MGVTQRLGTIPLAIQTDSSNNVGIGGAANASYKLAVTGAGNFTGALRTSSTFTSGDTIQLGLASTDGGFWTWGASNSFLVAATGKALNLNPNGASGTTGLSIATTGAATFSSSVTAGAMVSGITQNASNQFNAGGLTAYSNGNAFKYIQIGYDNAGNYGWIQPLEQGTAYRNLILNSAGGNVGIGTSSPSGILQVQNVQDGVSGKNLTLAYNGTYYAEFTEKSIRAYNNELIIGTGTGGTERMRITSGGFTKISNTGSYYSSTGPNHELRNDTSGDWNTIMTSTAANPYGLLIGLNPGISNTGNEFISAYTGNFSTLKFKVASNGGIYNYQSNDSNLSDIRTKKDITPLESYWNKFKAIEIVKFKYKEQSHDDYNIGVIAQQVEEVAPEFVNTEGWENKEINTDEPLKSIYTADLYHATIKVLQEAMAKIEELEAKVTALENK